MFHFDMIEDIHEVKNAPGRFVTPYIMSELNRLKRQRGFLVDPQSLFLGYPKLEDRFPMPVIGHEHMAPVVNHVAGVAPGSLGGLVNLAGVPRDQVPAGVPSSSQRAFKQEHPQQEHKHQQHAQQNETKQASELLHGFPDNKTTSAVDHGNQGEIYLEPMP